MLGVTVGPASSEPPPPAVRAVGVADYSFLKAQVFTAPGLGEIAVGMPNERVVKVQQRAEGGDWSRPRVLFHKKNVTCGEIDGRASAGGVALLLECDTYYFEENPPVKSMAFVTRDLTTWASTMLRGEAYQDPAISADGSHAAWLYGDHGQFMRFDSPGSFTTGQTSFDYDSGGETVVVDDAGTVTVMGPDNPGGGCGLGVYDKPVVGPEDRYRVDGVEPGCTEGAVENVDDRTVVGGGERPYRFVITRQPGQRWELGTKAPYDAPGLVKRVSRYRKNIPNVFADVAGRPLVSLVSTDRQRLQLQTYDDAAQTWGPPTTVYDHGFPGCTAVDRYFFGGSPRVFAIEIHCYPRPRSSGDYPPFNNQYEPAPAGNALVLTSSDGVTWTLTRNGRNPHAFSRTGALVAVPGANATTLVSTAGTVSVPRTAAGRCDVVYPTGPSSLLRLHGGRSARWPNRVQLSEDGGAWRTIQKVRMPRTGRCGRAQVDNDEVRGAIFLRGDGRYRSFRIKRGGPDGWRVVPFSY